MMKTRRQAAPPRRERQAAAQREPAEKPVQDQAENPRIAAQRQALHAAFGPALPVQSGAPSGVVQRVNLYAAALLTSGYFDHRPALRVPEFDKVKSSVNAAVRILLPHQTRLNTFLQQVNLAPDPANPLARKIAELRLLVSGTLNLKPTETRWSAVKTAEAALVGQDSDTFVAASFAHEQARMKAALHQMRADTFGTREFILTQLGDGKWMDLGQRGAVTTLRGLKDEVDAMMATLDTAADYTGWEGIPARLIDAEQRARDATDLPFETALAEGWNEVGPEVPRPREAALFFQAHIMYRHRLSSAAAGAGKFNTDDWGVIRGRITAALGAGALTGPHLNVADDRPRGRFEITYDSGAATGTTIAGHATNRIFVVVTSSGKTVVTAYPV